MMTAKDVLKLQPIQVNQETYEALEGSIKKWEGIVAGDGADHGRKNCNLCQKFNGFTEGSELNCSGCPVSEICKKEYCTNSPFEQWEKHHREKFNYRPYKAETKIATRLAQAELDFLLAIKSICRVTKS